MEYANYNYLIIISRETTPLDRIMVMEILFFIGAWVVGLALYWLTYHGRHWRR